MMPPPARTRTAQNNRYRREKRPDPQTGARRNQVVARSGLPTRATSRESGSTSRRRTAQCWPGVAALDRMQARSGLPFPSPNDKQCRTCLEKPSSRAPGWLAAAQFPAGARRKFRERRPADRSSRGLQTSATARPVAASASPSSEHDSTWSAPTRGFGGALHTREVRCETAGRSLLAVAAHATFGREQALATALITGLVHISRRVQERKQIGHVLVIQVGVGDFLGAHAFPHSRRVVPHGAHDLSNARLR